MPAIDNTTPYQRFTQQRRAAKQRGIAWELTFDEWMAIWMESGHFHERGKKAGQYVMGRVGDVGPYAKNNVYICTFAQNLIDAAKNNPNSMAPAGRLGKGCGWTFIKGSRKKPYQVVVAHRYIGVFATQAEAEAAYRLASFQTVVTHVA